MTRRTPEITIDLDQMARDELADRWKRHRAACLKLAVKIIPNSPEQAIEIAERFSAYILSGPPK